MAKQLYALCLVVALWACVSAAVVTAQTTPPPAVPDLLETTPLDPVTKNQWRQVAGFLWNYLLTNDYDFYDASGNIVSARATTSAAARSGASVQCGRFSRNFIRLAFHDCGTHSAFLKRFGCNGSIRLELPMTEPWMDYTTINPDGKSFRMVSPDVFDQFRSDGALHPQVDVKFNEHHMENAGSAASVAAFYQALLFARSPAVGLTDASFADVLILGSLLGMARCEGPHVRFVPGRVDAHEPDTADLLPAFADDFMHTLHYFYQSGLSELDAVTLIGGSHTTACFQAGCLDTTPTKTDKNWAAQVLNWDGVTPALCNVTAPIAPSTALCMGPSDVIWLQYPQTKQYLSLMLSPANTVATLQHEIQVLLDTQGVTGYKGLVPSANLCLTTARTCPGYAENWAFHTMLASSMFRLTQLRPANV